MTTDLKTAAQALCDVLPNPAGLAYERYFAKDELHALRAALAATPSVAVTVPTVEVLTDLYNGSHYGHPADFAAEVLERWGGWQGGILGCGGRLQKAYPYPAPTSKPFQRGWNAALRAIELAASPAAAMPSVAVDAKWRMVPVEPTEEMIREVYLQVPVTGLDDEAIGEIWSAMLDGVVTPQDANAPIYSLLEWACWRWREEVQDRPLGNVHRRTLDDTWRQVIRHSGGDPSVLVGPSHDERPSKEKSND